MHETKNISVQYKTLPTSLKAVSQQSNPKSPETKNLKNCRHTTNEPDKVSSKKHSPKSYST